MFHPVTVRVLSRRTKSIYSCSSESSLESVTNSERLKQYLCRYCPHSSEMASFSPNWILKYLKVSFIIFSIPFLFLVYIILNVLRKIAPKLLFNIATQKLPKFNQWKFSQKISGVEDLDFLFSYDIFEVSLYHQRLFSLV